MSHGWNTDETQKVNGKLPAKVSVTRSPNGDPFDFAMRTDTFPKIGVSSVFHLWLNCLVPALTPPAATPPVPPAASFPSPRSTD